MKTTTDGPRKLRKHKPSQSRATRPQNREDKPDNVGAAALLVSSVACSMTSTIFHAFDLPYEGHAELKVVHILLRLLDDILQLVSCLVDPILHLAFADELRKTTMKQQGHVPPQDRMVSFVHMVVRLEKPEYETHPTIPEIPMSHLS